MPLVDLLNALLWAGRKGPATYTRYFALGMQLSPALQHCFLSTWGAVMLGKKQNKTKTKNKKEFSRVLSFHVAVSSE